MSESRHCPQCGALVPSDPDISTLEDIQSGSTGPSAEAENDLDLPPVPLLAPGSNDDCFLAAPSASRFAAADRMSHPIELGSSSSSRSISKILEEPGRGRSSARFPSLNFDAPPQSRPGPDRPSNVEPKDTEELELEDDSEGRRKSWSSVLLASYASAITLALGWTLWKDRARDKAEESSLPPSLSAADTPRQSGLSGKVEPPEPILGEHFAKIGQPLKVGSLEVTPIEVKREDVTLERSNAYAKPEKKAGGKKAMILRLKLKNLSKDTVFAPLDQVYLRERGKQVVDTYIQAAEDDRIYPYPLALESEWSIVGQDFSELRPGESRVVAIVSTPEAPPDTLGPFTWRVRLRTGINRTDTIGVLWPPQPANPPK